MLSILGALISGILSGGATGLLGLLLQKWSEHKKQQHDLEVLKVNHANAIELRKLDLEAQERIANRTAEAQERVAELEALSRETEAQERSFQASHEADKATYTPMAAVDRMAGSKSRWVRFVGGLVTLLLGLVDVLRGSIRPGVTIYVLVLLTLLVVWVQDMYARSQLVLTPAQTQELAMQIIGTVTYLCTTVTVWWFGIRGNAPPKR